jgi:hypothetical protein
MTEEINEDCDRKNDGYSHQDSNRDPSERRREALEIKVTFLDNAGIGIPEQEIAIGPAPQGIKPIQ